MAGLLGRGAYELVPKAEEADIVVVNTCGFIGAAKEESIDAVLAAARLKSEGRVRTLVVAGCLPQRYPDELADELPEVDLFIGTGEIPRVAEILATRRGARQRLYVGLPHYLYEHDTPRLRSTPSYTTFVKVSEGCDHKCAFCIIPRLRGPHRSRPIESIVAEATRLGRDGVREINLIAQDLTAYGRDRCDGTSLYGLLRELEGVPDVRWFRLLYAYPNHLEERLLHLIRDSEKICKYIDIPFQHASPRLLRAMRRGKEGSAVREAVDRLRRFIPDVVLRTSLIVGFPGETDEDFRELLDFVEQTRFDRLGVFQYSREEGTPAATMAGQVSDEEKESRWQEIMELQAEISRKRNEALIGTTHEVIIDGLDPDSGALCGRTQGQAPEVDGATYIEGTRGALEPGSFVAVRITQAADYDLIGETTHA
jgi:ribosomal protein S12 methylthiotransferase